MRPSATLLLTATFVGIVCASDNNMAVTGQIAVEATLMGKRQPPRFVVAMLMVPPASLTVSTTAPARRQRDAA